MSKQPEALRLAEVFEALPVPMPRERKVAAELRRLHSLNAELVGALKVSRQFMSVASDWNFDEAEIDGEMRDTYDLIEMVAAAIAKAEA